MRLMGNYSVTVNGFRCRVATWDDALQRDGAGDEVFIHVARRSVDDAGNVSNTQEWPSQTIGAPDNGRYAFGSATDFFGNLKQGIADGDEFPNAGSKEFSYATVLNQPWQVPPYEVWRGQLISDWEGDGTDHWVGRKVNHENFVFITPTIWEVDPGGDVFQGWLDWQIAVDEKFGAKAKEIVTTYFPLAGGVFDAVHLGLMTADTLSDVWGLSGTRPIGMELNNGQRTFNPKILVLTQGQAEDFLAQANGMIVISYRDDASLRGDYDLFLQVHRHGLLYEQPPRDVASQPAPMPPSPSPVTPVPIGPLPGQPTPPSVPGLPIPPGH